MTDVVFLFPGQSSWQQDMFDELRTIDAALVDAVLEQATDILGFDIESLPGSNPVGRNTLIQASVFTANHLYMLMLHDRGVHSETSAGLSLGEYNHLVHIGALAFEEGLKLIHQRGIAYDNGPVGAMAALFPLSAEDVEIVMAVVNEQYSDEVLYIANYNAPTQFVVAGKREAVDVAIACAEEEFYATGIVIDPRIPMHTPIFKPVATIFLPALHETSWQEAAHSYHSNVTGSACQDSSAATITELLARHVYEPVQWCSIIDTLVSEHQGAVFMEVGPRTVVHDLLSPKWHIVNRQHTSPRKEDPLTHFNGLINEYRH